MKAWVLYGPDDLRLEERPIPKPNHGEVLLEVRATGICGSDIPRIFQTGAHVHPIIPGHEFSGVVAESEDPALIGKRVGVFPLIPCGKCEQCRKQKYEQCRNYSYLGSRCDGGFAEYAAVPAWNLIELPEAIPFDLAACLEPMSVAIHAIRRANVTADSSVTVIGLGTVGLFCLAVLNVMGVESVAALGNKAFQRDMVRKLGAAGDRYYEDAAALPESGVVLECVGKPETLAAALRTARPEGRVVAVGNPSGTMALPQENYWRILRNQLCVLGTWNSSFTKKPSDDWHFALELLEKQGPVFRQIITHRLTLDRLGNSLEAMRDKREPYGKIMAIIEKDFTEK